MDKDSKQKVYDAATEEINAILVKHGLALAIKADIAFVAGQWIDRSQIVFVEIQATEATQ